MFESHAGMVEDALRTTLKRLLIVVAFSIAFAYIESAVVVYLRVIFHPEGFTFPLRVFDATARGKRLLLTEVGREAATLVLILTAAWLSGETRQRRWAYFLAIFAVWDIFYYVWLKVMIDWPASIMDWDVLFLIPVVWAAPVLYPVLVSLAMFVIALVLLYRCARSRPIVMNVTDWLGMFAGATVIVVSFCIGGTHAAAPDYAQYFDWPLFGVGYILALAAFARASARPAQNE